MDLTPLLKLMVEKRARIFYHRRTPPSIKVNGRIVPVTKQPLSPEQAKSTVLQVMTEKQKEVFDAEHECNFAISARGVGRFRVSAFYQRNLAGMVLRRIETEILMWMALVTGCD